jgi:hypothetical protein
MHRLGSSAGSTPDAVLSGNVQVPAVEAKISLFIALRMLISAQSRSLDADESDKRVSNNR